MPRSFIRACVRAQGAIMIFVKGKKNSYCLRQIMIKIEIGSGRTVWESWVETWREGTNGDSSNRRRRGGEACYRCQRLDGTPRDGHGRGRGRKLRVVIARRKLERLWCVNDALEDGSARSQ